MTSKIKIDNKVCPEDFSKPHLVRLTAKKLDIPPKKIVRLNKDSLCKSYESGKIVSVPASKRKKTQAKAPTKRPTKKVPIKRPAKKAPIHVTVSPYPDPEGYPKSPPSKIKPPKIIAKKPCIEQSNLALKEHQIRVVNHIRNHRGLIVSHTVGSGKTLTAVTATQCYLEDNPRGRVIIVTPVSLQENFKKEMRAYGVDPDGAAWKDKYHFFTLQSFANAYKFKRCPADAMLVVDEAHELRTIIKSKKTSVDTSRAAVAVRCASTVKKVLLLTATTVYNTPYDIANLVAMVRGDTPPTKREFENIMSDPAKFKKFFSCVLSFYDIPKDENYPEVEESWVEIEMSPQYYREYRNVELKNSHLFNWENPWRFLTGVRQASNALKICDKCKVIIDRFKAKPVKTVIYSAFLSFGLRRIQEMFKSEEIPYVEITGKMKKAERDASVRKYNADQVKVLFITQSGGVGLDLKKTRVIYIFESSWNRPREEQVIGRGVRYRSHAGLPKKERKVDVYHLIMVKPKSGRDRGDDRDSADEILRKKMVEKDLIGKDFLKDLYKLSIEQIKC